MQIRTVILKSLAKLSVEGGPCVTKIRSAEALNIFTKIHRSEKLHVENNVYYFMKYKIFQIIIFIF